MPSIKSHAAETRPTEAAMATKADDFMVKGMTEVRKKKKLMSVKSWKRKSGKKEP